MSARGIWTHSSTSTFSKASLVPGCTFLLPAPIVQFVECPRRRTWGHRFDPGSQHTKVVKNGTSCASLSDLRGRARTGPPSVKVMWLGLVSCEVSGHDTSVRQRFKSEHWAPCRNQTPSWYDWKLVESDVKPEHTTTTFLLWFVSSVLYRTNVSWVSQRVNMLNYSPFKILSDSSCNIVH